MRNYKITLDKYKRVPLYIEYPTYDVGNSLSVLFEENGSPLDLSNKIVVLSIEGVATMNATVYLYQEETTIENLPKTSTVGYVYKCEDDKYYTYTEYEDADGNAVSEWIEYTEEITNNLAKISLSASYFTSEGVFTANIGIYDGTNITSMYEFPINATAGIGDIDSELNGLENPNFVNEILNLLTTYKNVVDENVKGISEINTEIENIYTEMEEKIAALVDSSPEALNTLNELAQALGNDPDFATTVLNKLSQKLEVTMYNKDKETQNVINDSKVDKLDGKGLSANDYTDEEKEKLGKLPANKEYQAEISKINENIALKADKAHTLAGYGIADAYTKEKTDDLLAQLDDKKADVGSVLPIDDSYHRDYIDELLSLKADKSDSYTKAEIDTQINTFDERIGYLENDMGNKADISDTYTKEEIDNQIGSIETALDNIIAIQEALTGGES